MRNWFQDVYAQIRRFIARLHEDLPNKRELMKIEYLFAKAAKASNSSAQTQKSPTQTSGVQYAMSAADVVDRYDQRSYTNYGWVVANDVLSDVEYKSLNKQLSEATMRGYRYPRNTNGEYMITVGDMYSFEDDRGHERRMQHANKIVFVSGTVQNPIISRVVEVDYTIADDVSCYVEGVIENEQYGIDYIAFIESYEGKTIFRAYKGEDFPSFAEIQQQQKGGENPNPFDSNEDRGGKQERGRSGAPSDGSTGVNYSLPSQSALQALSQGGDGGMGSTDTQGEETPRKRRLTKSQYIKRMLDDPAVGAASPTPRASFSGTCILTCMFREK